MSPEFIAGLAEKGTTALILGVFAWALLNYLLKDQREAFHDVAASMKEVQKQQKLHTASIATLMQILLAHDLTVRGINPSAGKDMNERADIAYKVYTDLQRDLAHLRDQILSDTAERAPRR